MTPAAPFSSKSDRKAEPVLTTLLHQIFDETYGPGARLPAERELAVSMGASRASIREVFQRLEDWHVIDIWPSGALVRRERYWSLAVLPAFVRYCHQSGDRKTLARLVVEAMDMRQSLLTHLIDRHVIQLRAGSLDRAREFKLRAWRESGHLAAFLAHDLEVERCVLEAAGMRSSLWQLNPLAEANRELLPALQRGKMTVPETYEKHREELFASLENHDREGARSTNQQYFESHIAEMLRALGL